MRVSLGRGLGPVPPWAAGSLASPLPEFLLWALKEQRKWMMHSRTEKQETALQGSRGSPIKSLGGTPGPGLGPLQPCSVCPPIFLDLSSGPPSTEAAANTFLILATKRSQLL